MDTLINFMLIIGIAVPITGIYMMIRNECVYRCRQELLKAGRFDEYDALPDYDTMVLRFWDWNFKEMKK